MIGESAAARGDSWFAVGDIAKESEAGEEASGEEGSGCRRGEFGGDGDGEEA